MIHVDECCTVTVGRRTDRQMHRGGQNKEQCPTAVGGRPAWPRCPHTWLAGLDAHGLEASGEDGGVCHIGIQALLLAPVDEDHHDEKQSQTQSHRHHAHVERHVLGPAHGCNGRRTTEKFAIAV